MKLWWHRHAWQLAYKFEDEDDRRILHKFNNIKHNFGHLHYSECMSCGERRAITAGYAPWMDEYTPHPLIVDWDYINFKSSSPSSPSEIYYGRVMYQNFGVG